MEGDYSNSTQRGCYSRKYQRLSPSVRAAQPPKSTSFVNINIDDLPDNVLADILSRLPSFDYVCKYRYVCKRWWCIIKYDLYFRGRYLLRHKQVHQPPPLTLINKSGETFPIKLTPSSPKFLSRLFRRLMTVMSRTCEPVMVGASCDLVLCCETEYFQRHYFICNPFSLQWVSLPPPSRVLRDVPVGFICEPYYEFVKKDEEKVYRRREKSVIIDDGSEEQIYINPGYRCKVVRILPYDDKFEHGLSSKFKLEIFSLETFEWRESIISFPRQFSFDRINSDSHVFHNGMLYWSSTWAKSDNFLIGLDPLFMIDNLNIKTNTSSSNSDDNHHDNYYKGRFIELSFNHDPDYDPRERCYQIHCLSVQGSLKMCILDSFDKDMSVWELKKDEDLNIAGDGAGILCWEGEGVCVNGAEEVDLIGFHPEDEGYLYVRLDGVDGVDGACVDKINVHTRVSDLDRSNHSNVFSNYCFFPIVVDPWWPTPLS